MKKPKSMKMRTMSKSGSYKTPTIAGGWSAPRRGRVNKKMSQMSAPKVKRRG